MFWMETSRMWHRGAAALLAAALLAAPPAWGKDKKEKQPPQAPSQPNLLEQLDYSKIVWPNPPAIARIKYTSYFSGEKFKPKDKQQKKKTTWKERLAGLTAGQQSQLEKPRFQLVMPYGMAVDSKGRLYIADRKVKAVFVVTPETGDFEMIKHGAHARFNTIIGVAIDDGDRIYVSDDGARRVLVFDPKFQVEASISEGMASPGGLAIDNENRFLYVVDSDLDQVLVYDADPPYKLLRRIGTSGKKHTLTTPGDFAMPSNVAVDADGNLYVTDMLNSRVQIFDADGNFVRAFGKAGDGPGYFARPKGIAVDSDGHIWVADAVQDRVQVFDQQGRLLIWMGSHGLLPGQFRALAGLAVDKNNRVFTSEQYPGRVQFFRYVTDAEAQAEKERREAQEKKPAGGPAKGGN